MIVQNRGYFEGNAVKAQTGCLVLGGGQTNGYGSCVVRSENTNMPEMG